MDEKLRFRVNATEKQIDQLYEIQGVYLTLESAKDMKWNAIFRQAPEGTIKDREAWAYTHPEYAEFVKALNEAKREFDRAKNRLTLKFKAIDAEHLSLKIEKLAIERGGI